MMDIYQKDVDEREALIAVARAAKIVKRGLDARLELLSREEKPLPVFDGIAELHSALAALDPATRKEIEG